MDLPARSFDLARPGVAPPLFEMLLDLTVCTIDYETFQRVLRN